MHSSTSHSSAAVPWIAVRLLLVAIVAWALGAFYTLRVNPEVAFFRHGHEVKEAWRQKLDREHSARIAIYGGSSCATSVESARMLQHHDLPVLNLGLGAGMGARILTRYALLNLRRGDTLLVMLEPGLLTKRVAWQTLGVQFSLAAGQPALLDEPGGKRWLERGLNLRPGAYHLFTLFGKILLRQPLYRYKGTDWQPDGWQLVTLRREIPALPVVGFQLSTDGRAWLAYVRAWCDEQGVRVAYVMPWSWCPVDKLAAWQQTNAAFLRDVCQEIPVLKDPRLGVYSVREHFGDTEFHPNADGAAVRTDELARQIKLWETWTIAELNEKCRP